MNEADPTELQFIRNELALHDAAIEATQCGITIADARLPDLPLTYVNQAFCRLSGYDASEVLGRNCRFLQGDDRNQAGRQIIREAIEKQQHCEVLLKNYRKDGSSFWNELTMSPVFDPDGQLTHYVGVQNDVTDREEARQEAAAKQAALEATQQALKEAQSMLVHSEKMNALGQLVAGVAHEINNPVSYIFSSVHALKEMSNDLKAAYLQLYDAVKEEGKEPLQEIARRTYAEADIDYIVSDLDDLIDSALEGLSRVRRIVESLRCFSRQDEAEVKTVSLQECIESTLEIADNALTGRLKIVCQLNDLPACRCRPSELNQVFLNLIVNASQAIGRTGRLDIRGHDHRDALELTFTDNGKGMDAATQAKIFNPFFTTKPVGEGTGLGLSIAYKIITEGHGGTITVRSQPGKGATFTITLPKGHFGGTTTVVP